MGRFMHPSGQYFFRFFSPPRGESAVFQVIYGSGWWHFILSWRVRICSCPGWWGERVALHQQHKGSHSSSSLRALPGPEQHGNEGSLINKGFLLCCVEVCSYQQSWQLSKTEMTVVGCKRDNCQISWDISLLRFSISYLS